MRTLIATLVLVAHIACYATADTPVVLWSRPANSSWAYPVTGEHTPAVDGNSVYIDGGRGYLCCLDKKTGKQRWAKRSDDAMEPEVAAWCSPVVADGTVYAMCQGNSLYAFDPASGRVKWEAKQISGGVPPAVSGDIVCAGGDTVLQAFDSATGEEKWASGAASDPSFMCIADQTVYVDGNDGRLLALDAATGKEKWHLKIDQRAQYCPLVCGEMVYFPGAEGTIYAVDRSTGKEKWRFRAFGVTEFAQETVNGTIYFASARGFVYAVDARNGHKKWGYGAGANVSAPVIVNGRAYFGDELGRFYCVKITNGQLLWRIYLGGEMVSPPVYSDGVAYIWSGLGRVFAVKVE